MNSDRRLFQVTRRNVLRGSGLLALTGVLPVKQAVASVETSGLMHVANQLTDQLVLDLAGEPANLDPATTYDVNGWSIIHSIYDSVVQYGPTGELEPLLAEQLEQIDSMTWEIRLRAGILFHNGEPLTSESIRYSIAHITDEATGSQIAGNFAVIDEVELVDDLTARLKLSAPAPWLPAQMAAWLVLLPPIYASENDWLANPVGTGPYEFRAWKPGASIELARSLSAWPGSAKGDAIAEVVVFRFVPESSTRVSDLLTGSTDIIRNVGPNDLTVIESAGATARIVDTSGSSWIRIPTDVPPFSDVRVRQALNYAVDVQSIIDGLLGGFGQRLPNVFAPAGLGFDESLAPFPFDPERARTLLTEAGYPDGFETAIDYAVTENADIVLAVAGQLEEVDIRTKTVGHELAVFNTGDWWKGKDPEAAPLRFVTWRPLFDPHTLLSLVISNQGFLSRYDIETVQVLLDQFAVETDATARAAIGKELGLAMFDEPAAIYLYSLTSLFGAAAEAPEWTTRADDYLIPVLRDTGQ